MKAKEKLIILMIAGVVFVLFGCNLPGQTLPAVADENELMTRAAETLEVYLTETRDAAGKTEVPGTTGTPLFPTATLTDIPTATNTLVPTVAICDWAQYIADVTVPDGTVFTPGAEFVKTWRLRNIGVCTWTTEYELSFVEGNGMNSEATVPIAITVVPSATGDVSLNLRAPIDPGSYRGYWDLRNESGITFGIGPGANEPFWVDIEVMEPSNAKYDFAVNYCLADWESDSKNDLPCPGVKTSNKGFVLMLTDPDLENRQENEPAIWAHPNNDSDGWISGKYPAIKIKNGDHFKSWVGCLDDSNGCNVTFKLEYQIDGGVVQSLGEWDEVYDEDVTKLDIDLSALVGEKVNFILSVDVNGGKPANANAFWFVPRIEN